jgi:hypothetical protein
MKGARSVPKIQHELFGLNSFATLIQEIYQRTSRRLTDLARAKRIRPTIKQLYCRLVPLREASCHEVQTNFSIAN